ncbi:hypothetical protein ABIB37_002455 [Agrococcus sp. UYP10]|uniref:leucine-rich repeat domain-containing protein n=1 Tax=Agrococcus sp. UYP10 TaxID=1756355 RepID=UPI003398EC17
MEVIEIGARTMPEFMHSAVAGVLLEDPSDYRGESAIAVPLTGRWAHFFEVPQPVISLTVLSILSPAAVGVLEQQPDLRELQLGGRHLTTLDALSGLSQIQSLNVTGAHELADVSALASLPNVERLALHGVTGALQYRPLGGATSLRELWLTAGPRDLSWIDVEDLDWVSPLQALESVLFIGVRVRNKDLSPLAQLPALTRLHLPQRREYRAQIERLASSSPAFRTEAARFAENVAALRALKEQQATSPA